jgi:hypothetical protein
MTAGENRARQLVNNLMLPDDALANLRGHLATRLRESGEEFEIPRVSGGVPRSGLGHVWLWVRGPAAPRG